VGRVTRERTLWQVAGVHAALLATLVLLLGATGPRGQGALLGGGLIGFSYVSFWMVARSIAHPRGRPVAILLGSLKILLYFGLTAAALTGTFVTDGAGFALGVTSFVAAVVAVAALQPSGDRAATAMDH